MLHITEFPPHIKRLRARHKPTLHDVGVIPDHTNVETTSGTVPSRPSDILVESESRKKVWPLSPEEFAESYDLIEE